MVDGNPRWLQGIYSLHVSVGTEELATLIFNVQ
jgi:hypothetical protein